ncbi:aldo/keto reductase [Asticcacaulis sp. 201]|uniref:aldo/keto reductase n=1 Tax=Asticcacaulis sp. 201 TaxID=3028787 RepID=UPI0029163255|nr:aldo/keto reductase [Asticcacaulis sp. 201]MDV6331042.1 aldo/keto reductase [Asticcacaulis sp. 201]
MNFVGSKVGLGCGLGAGVSRDVLVKALKSGIRYLDTASFYQVGALSELDEILLELGIPRDEVHLSQKLWVTDLGRNRSHDGEAHLMSLKSIYEGLLQDFSAKRFDSLIIHWPLKTDDAGFADEFRIEEVWPQLEALVYDGCVPNIGVSNFNILEMQRLLSIARIKPYSAQIEFNPFAHNNALLQFCQNQGVNVVAHTPFHFGQVSNHLNLFSDPCIKAIAEKYGRPPAQIVLSWIMRHGIFPIPATSKVEHVDDYVLAANDAYLDFEDIQAISALNRDQFSYLGNLNAFNLTHHRKYHCAGAAPHALVPPHEGLGGLRPVSIYDPQFIRETKKALTDGAGFVVLPGALAAEVRAFKEGIPRFNLQNAGRYEVGLFNAGTEILEIIDNPLVALVVETVLGWDCIIDNIAMSTSRPAPDSAIFGPHQDSPFDRKVGAPLPPPSYPVVLQCIIAMDEFTEDNGALYVIPHTHKKQQRITLPWQGGLTPGTIPDGAVKVICPEGSVVVAVGHIWHGTFANVTDTPRKGMLIEFVTSFCEPAHKFSADTLSNAFVENCSKRVVRILNNGSGILQAYRSVREGKLSGFTKPPRSTPVPVPDPPAGQPESAPVGLQFAKPESITAASNADLTELDLARLPEQVKSRTSLSRTIRGLFGAVLHSN